MLLLIGCGKNQNPVTNNYYQQGLAQWELVGNVATMTVNALAVSNSQDVFIGSDIGVYHSSNNGITWTIVKDSLYVYTLAVSGNTIFKGTGRGIYRSSDNGASWTSAGLQDTEIRALAVSGSQNVFAGTYGKGVYHSSDNGASWAATGVRFADTSADTSINILAVSGNYIFAVAYCQGNTRVYRSQDNGATWATLSDSLFWVNSLVVSGSNIFVAGYYGVYRSSDNGATWTSTSLKTNRICMLAVSGSDIFAATYAGVLRSTDNGATWTQAGDGLDGSQCWYIIANSSYLFNASNLGYIWRLPLAGL